MTNLFVVSDIHGMYPQFEELLTNWNDSHRLIILGDMIDRGDYSRDVVQKVMALQEKYGADHVIVLKGNHEDMLSYFIDDLMDPAIFLKYGGRECLQSFLGDFDETDLRAVRKAFEKTYSKELEFLRNARSYYQVGQLLFTHAGFDAEHANWQRTKPESFLWTRKHYEKPNITGLINVFGHTPVREIHSDERDTIWRSSCGYYIGIDGGCAYGGQLNGLLIAEDGTVRMEYVVKQLKEMKQTPSQHEAGVVCFTENTKML